jgi:hypothetical protein
MSGPLHELSKRLSDVHPAKASALSLLEICRRLQNPLARTNVGYRFSILNPAMRQLFWLPSLMKTSPADTWILVLMAYWYAMIMSLEPIRYAPVSQLMRSSCIAPVTAISGRLNELPERDEKELACQLMELPVMIANDMQDQIKQHEREVRSAGLRRGIGIEDGEVKA